MSRGWRSLQEKSFRVCNSPSMLGPGRMEREMQADAQSLHPSFLASIPNTRGAPSHVDELCLNARLGPECPPVILSPEPHKVRLSVEISIGIQHVCV